MFVTSCFRLRDLRVRRSSALRANLATHEVFYIVDLVGD